MEQNGTDDRFALLTAPLLEEATALSELLASLEDERLRLGRQLRRLEAAIKHLNGGYEGQGKRKTVPRKTRVRPKGQAVEDYLLAHGELESFTSPELTQVLNESGITIGKDRVRVMLAEMHERGLLRLERKGRGGTKHYRLLGVGE